LRHRVLLLVLGPDPHYLETVRSIGFLLYYPVYNRFYSPKGKNLQAAISVGCKGIKKTKYLGDREKMNCRVRECALDISIKSPISHCF